MMENERELLEQLAQPFPPDAITWKPGNTTKDGSKCMAMAYGDLRAYQARLDEVCGLNWSVRYQPWHQERIICELTIHGVTRSSTGEYGTQDEKNNIEGTVAEAQAFKRAAAMFGLGRYLYDLPSVWIEFDAGAKKISKAGQEELDRRYKEWYRKATAQKPSQATQTPVATIEGTPPHQRMWGVGMSIFGLDWDMARSWVVKKWTERHTPDNIRESSADLSDDEKDLLADSMNSMVKDLQRIWPKQKAIMAKAQAEQQPA